MDIKGSDITGRIYPLGMTIVMSRRTTAMRSFLGFVEGSLVS